MAVYCGKKHNLEMNVKFCAAGNMKGRRAIGWVRQIRGRGLERLGTRQALIEAREIDVPGGMNRFGILLPMAVHFIGIISIGAVREQIIG